MKIPETKSAVLNEFDRWEEIIHSEAWLAYLRLVDEHCGFLQREANDHLRKHEDRAAGEALRAMDDARKITDLVKARITALRNAKDKPEQ